MDYFDILVFKKYTGFTAEDVNDYSTYNFGEQTKPSIAQITAWNIEYKKSLCKAEAKQRIAEYDWVIDTETTPDLLNREDFIAYRSALRQLILNPVENPVFPEVPQEEWA